MQGMPVETPARTECVRSAGKIFGLYTRRDGGLT